MNDIPVPEANLAERRSGLTVMARYAIVTLALIAVSAYGAWIFAREGILNISRKWLSEERYLYLFTDLRRPEVFGKCDGHTGGVYDVVIEASIHEIKFTATDPEGRTITPETPRQKYEDWIESGAHWAMSVGGGYGPSTRSAYSTHLKQGDYVIRLLAGEEYNHIPFNMDVKLPNRCIRLVNNTALNDIPRKGFVLNLYDINAPPRELPPKPPPSYSSARIDDATMLLSTETYSFEYPSYVSIRDRYESYLEWPGASSTVATFSDDKVIYTMPEIEFGGLYPFQGTNIFDPFLLQADGHRSSIDTDIPSMNDISFKKNKHGIEYAEFYVNQVTIRYEENGDVNTTNQRVGPNVIFDLPSGAYLKMKSGKNSRVQKEEEGHVQEPYSTALNWDFLTDFQSIVDSVRVKMPESTPRPGGVGAMFSSGTTFPSAVEVLPGSPAEEAGLRQNDYVLSIDGWSTAEASMEEVVQRLRGDAGTSVTLIVRAPDYDGITIYEDENAVMPERQITITRRDLSPYVSSLRKQIEMDARK